MNTLIRHIEYLISRSDCVIIPRVGAILATTVHASYDAENHVLTPPQRVLTFNCALDHNDGILVASVQRAEGISYEAASRKVKAGVDAMLSLLASQGRVRLGRLGVIERRSMLLSFSAADEALPSAATLWLEPLRFEPLHADNVIEAPIVKHGMRRFSRIARIAASIAVLIGLGFVLSTPIHVSDSMLASLAPELVQSTVEELVPERADDPVLTLVLPSAQAGSAIDTSCRSSLLAEPEAEYFVVVAALATLDDSMAYIAEHPGVALRISNAGKYYRVYTSAHTSPIEAYRASLEAESAFPGAWVCKR